MRYPPDEYSSHEYEVQKVRKGGEFVDELVFYLRVGEPVNIKIEEVLKKVGLWEGPPPRHGKRKYPFNMVVLPEGEPQEEAY